MNVMSRRMTIQFANCGSNGFPSGRCSVLASLQSFIRSHARVHLRAFTIPLADQGKSDPLLSVTDPALDKALARSEGAGRFRLIWRT